MIKKFGYLIEYPENDWRESHGEDGCVDHQSENGAGDGEVTSDERDDDELRC